MAIVHVRVELHQHSTRQAGNRPHHRDRRHGDHPGHPRPALTLVPRRLERSVRGSRRGQHLHQAHRIGARRPREAWRRADRSPFVMVTGRLRGRQRADRVSAVTATAVLSRQERRWSLLLLADVMAILVCPNWDGPKVPIQVLCSFLVLYPLIATLAKRLNVGCLAAASRLSQSRSCCCAARWPE